MGGRAEHPWLHGGHLERQNVQASRPCNDMNDTQEIAKSFWSYLYLWRFELGLCLNYLL
jgi:hypothetical protein